MCGIVGVFGDPSYKLQKMFKDLLQLDVIRGPHSTGYAVFGKKHKVLEKDTVLPQELIYTKRYKEDVENKVNIITTYLGHNRAATIGDIVKENAHPFKHGHITGVHNGTLYTKMRPDNKDFGTDSEGIIYAINKHGIDWVWTQLWGAASLAWWNNMDKTFNIVSNGQRPLTFAYGKEKKFVIVASEKWMIEAVVDRHDMDLEDQVWSPKDHNLFVWKLEKGVISPSGRVLKTYAEVRRNEYKKRAWPIVKTNNVEPLEQPNRQTDFNDLEYWRRINGLGRDNPELFDDDVPFGTATNQKDKTITKENFHVLYKQCFLCHKDLEDEYETAVIVDSRNAACEECTESSSKNGVRLSAIVGA